MLIESQREFEAFTRRIEEHGAFGFDTEFLREKTYRPRLCLLQLSAAGECVAVDPFAVEDLRPLARLIADPDVATVVHAGLQDFEIFWVRYRTLPRAVFDTQVAAALIGLGESMGYARLVRAVIGVKPGKGETFTDWTRRPLAESQVRYALEDVRHLLPLRERLEGDLRESERWEWLEEEVAFYGREATYARDPGTLYRRVGGGGKLDRRELAVLRELAAWREAEAERCDRPRARIVGDSILVELARRSPRDGKELDRFRGLHPALLRRSGREILRCVAEGLQCPEENLPAVLDRGGARDGDTAVIVDFLQLALALRAQEARVGASYLASRSELQDLVRRRFDGSSPLEEHRLLQGWRGEVAGRALLDLLEGRSWLGFAPDSRRVRIERRASRRG